MSLRIKENMDTKCIVIVSVHSLSHADTTHLF